MKTGLTLGKYAPLHHGHQLLIETALAEMDRVIVLIYDVPETTPCPLPLRAGWLRRLYPQIEVLEAWDGPTVVGAAPEITALHDRYLRERLGARGITHFYSSEFYGDHVSRALGAVDRRIDPQRTAVPISATQIRQQPYVWRHFLPPLVYRDLITRVVLLGAPSTGKTTLAERLATHFNTVWTPEYGREYWEKHQRERRLTPEQLVEIAQGHREREDRLAAEADTYLFIDTDATTTRLFSLYYHGAVHPELEALADEAARRYDLFFLCEDDIPYADTWDRSGTVQRRVMQQQIRADLQLRNIPFISLTGSIEKRLRQVNAVLASHTKFCSLGNALAPFTSSTEPPGR